MNGEDTIYKGYFCILYQSYKLVYNKKITKIKIERELAREWEKH